MSIQEIFNRYELKYIISKDLYDELIIRMEPYIQMDKNARENCGYTVTSLYFDTLDSYFYHQRENGVSFRQKLRLRVYGDCSLEGKSFLEIKKKYKGRSNKRRAAMSLLDAYRYLGLTCNVPEDWNINVSNPMVLKEISCFKSQYDLIPKMVLSYDRMAFQGTLNRDLRITFDRNIRSRAIDLQLEKGSFGELLLDPDLIVMEVKVLDSVPIWLVKILEELIIRKAKCSKYSTSIQKGIYNRERDIKLIV